MTNLYTGTRADWSQAFIADPHFYAKQSGAVFGVLGMNEGIATVVPKLPQERYRYQGHVIGEWRMLLYSRTLGKVIGDADFFSAMRKLISEDYILDENETQLLIRPLSLSELDALMRAAAKPL